MKVRNGFVSNSSSSSFIVAMDDPDKPIQMPLYFKFSDFGTVITTEEQALKYFLKETGYKTLKELRDSDPDYTESTYDVVVEAVKNGKKIVCGDVSSDDDNHIAQMIYDDGFPKGIKGVEIIQDV